MFRSLIVFASLLSSAVAFRSVMPARASSPLMKMSFKDEVGALPPTGFWDPLGLVADGDKAKFDLYREAELKHGRVAMLAVLGYIVQEFYRLPGKIIFMIYQAKIF